MSEAPQEEGKKQRVKLLIDEDVGEEEYMPTSNVITSNLVIIVCIVIVISCKLFFWIYGWSLGSPGTLCSIPPECWSVVALRCIQHLLSERLRLSA